jgi:hypothetical protein
MGKRPRRYNLLGRRFGRLVVVAKAPSRGSSACWECQCDCGTSVVVRGGNLVAGHTKSCGCCQRESARAARTTHGMSKSQEYKIWRGMLDRCENPNHTFYHLYGGRGIEICEEWHCFESFYADMGARPSPKHTLDRIDNDGGYSPANCRWATSVQQQGNRTNSRILTFRGESMCLAAWARRIGCSEEVIRARLKSGWSIERALTTPVRHWRRKHDFPVQDRLKHSEVASQIGASTVAG